MRKETISHNSMLTKLCDVECTTCFGLMWPSTGTHLHRHIKKIGKIRIIHLGQSPLSHCSPPSPHKQKEQQ